MADTKISAAADIVTLNGTDMLPVARSASSTAYHATMAEVSTFANTNLPTASTTVLGAVKVDGSTITIASGVISGSVVPTPFTGTPAMDGTGAPGASANWSRGDHIHPSDTTKAPLASPTFTGTPSLPTGTIGVTQTTGNNSTALATTAFVQSQLVASGAGVSTWNTRAGAVVLQQSDIVAVGALDDVGRNLLHNPVYTVAQRGAGPWSTTVYTADRWLFNLASDTSAISQAVSADSDRAGVGNELMRNHMACAVAGNAASGSLTQLVQNIEDVRRLGNKTVTVSFYAVASAAALKLGVNIVQYFGTGGSPSATVNGNGQSVTLTTSWARYSLTFAVPSIAGKTIGTNNDNFTRIAFWYSAGSSNATLSGGVGVQSGTINLWGPQCEYGSVATPLDYGGSPADQLRQCQRYYQTHNYSIWGYNSASGVIANTFVLPVAMRAGPTIVLGTASTNTNASSPAVVVFGSIGGNYNTLQLQAAATAAGAVAYANSFTASADL